MNRLHRAVIALLAVHVIMVAGAPLARAADTPNPNGKWKFTLTFPETGFGELKLDCLLDIKVDGEKVTGKIGATSGEGIVDVLDGKWKDEELSFRVVDPQGIPSRYKGKIVEDKIKGKFECDVPGFDVILLDWNATREKEEKK